MNIKLFFEITKEFFDAMYSIYVEEEGEEKNVDEDKNVDEEKGLEEDACYCNACSICRQICLVIDRNMSVNKLD